jgi:hypothetical protein
MISVLASVVLRSAVVFLVRVPCLDREVQRDLFEQKQLLGIKEMERRVEIEQLQEELNALLDFRKEKVTYPFSPSSACGLLG